MGMTPASKLHRRYRLLFTLPNIKTVVILAAFTSIPIPIISILYTTLGITSSIIILIAFLLSLYATSVIDMVLARDNPIASFRRISSIPIFSNGLWTVTVIIGVIASMLKASTLHFYSLLILGLFFASGFRLFIFGSLFFERLLTAALASLLQPTVLAASLIILLPPFSFNSIAIASGLILMVSVYIYLIQVDRSGGAFIKKPFKMLKAFTQAWTVNRPDALESIIEDMSSTEPVCAGVICFKTFNGRHAVILPDAHPGPFYPIGSSNLPYELYRFFKDRGYSPMVLHSISGHEFNLPSKGQVQSYLLSLASAEAVAFAEGCTHPTAVKIGATTVTGMAFGDIALMLVTLSPIGMEDFPDKVKSEVEDFGLKLGFKAVLIVDAHNCQGSIPSEEACSDVIEAGESVLRIVKDAPQYRFKVGYSHSTEFEHHFGRDVGPAGMALLALVVEDRRYILVSVDANNAVQGLREKLIDALKPLQTDVMDICTTDTHITAGKVMDVKGYLALGEETGLEELSRVINLMSERAFERLEYCTAQLDVSRAALKVIGSNLLYGLSRGLDKVIHTAKRGAAFVAIFALILLTLNIIL